MHSPRPAAIRSSAILVITLLIGACASTPNTYSNVDINADFGQYKTFGFFATLATDRSGYETSESRYLKNAVTREMRLRNIQPADKPDLIINFYINTSDKIRARQTPTAGGYYGYRGSYYGAWGGYETHIDQYTEGTLNVDVVDPRTQKLVWEGTIVGKITDAVLNNLESAIDEAVKEIFKQFPVPPRSEIVIN
jgi:hypothetical protein